MNGIDLSSIQTVGCDKDGNKTYSYDAADLARLNPITALRIGLHIDCIVTTPSGYAVRLQKGKYVIPTFKRIGSGDQGVVYERLGNLCAYKKERHTNLGLPLRQEFAAHKRVWDAFAKYRHLGVKVHVPRLYALVDKERMPSNWFRNDKLPPTDVMIMERIVPLPKVLCKALIETFHPYAHSEPHVTAEILSEPANKHCLARVLLGVYPKPDFKVPEREFSLQSFPLSPHYPGLWDIYQTTFARMMGGAYAIMHWAAHVTGDRAKFVLGTSVSGDGGVVQHRAVNLYLFDFGDCPTIDMTRDKEHVFYDFKERMVQDYNQPYIPHPKMGDGGYEDWKASYLYHAKEIIRSEGLAFDPEEFLKEYEECLERRRVLPYCVPPQWAIRLGGDNYY